MKTFDIFSFKPDGPNWKEAHPAVIISHPDRTNRKNPVEIIVGSTQRAARAAEAGEFILDEADGLDWPTIFKCDLIYASPKEVLSNRRGRVTDERHAPLIRKIIAAHGWDMVLAR